MKKRLSGKEKAAIFMLAMGSEISSAVCRHLSNDDQEILSLEIAARKVADSGCVESVLNEFRILCKAGNLTAVGGPEYAGKVLRKIHGKEKGDEIVNRISAPAGRKPFDTIGKVEADSLLALLRNEHPQTVAVVLANVEPAKASAVLAGMSRKMQSDVAGRIALMDRTEPETLLRIEKILEKKQALRSAAGKSADGTGILVDILAHMDRASGENIINAVMKEDPELRSRLKGNNLSFDDIALLDDASIVKILRATEPVEVEKALRTADFKVRERILGNLSPELSEKVLSNESRPIPIPEIEKAQENMTALVRKLMEKGEIAFA